MADTDDAVTATTGLTGPDASADDPDDSSDADPADDGPRFDLGDGGTACVNLECDQTQCGQPAATTSISGTVFDPSGNLPLPSINVYIPNAPVEPLEDQLSCDQCDAQLSGAPLVATQTDAEGHFVLENVPADTPFPLVMQVGKWRRIIEVAPVPACQHRDVTDPAVTRLPRSSQEGSIPRIALTTGSADPLFCLLRRLGIDDTEYGIAGSPARIHFYRGASGSSSYSNGFGASPGASFPNARDTLWNDGWDNYDIVMLSCEGSENASQKNGRRDKLRDYINGGGRVFATHYHYTWMRGDAPDDLAGVANFRTNFNGINGNVDIDTSFPKGESLANWLDFVDGSSAWGRFQVSGGRDHTTSISSAAQRWVTRGSNEQIMYFSFNAPIGAPEAQQCGRMVYSDIHVSGSAGSPTAAFPGACNNSELSEQEKVLLFMLFDLSSCIVPDNPPG